MERKLLLLPVLLYLQVSLQDRQEDKSAGSMEKGVCAHSQAQVHQHESIQKYILDEDIKRPEITLKYRGSKEEINVET